MVDRARGASEARGRAPELREESREKGGRTVAGRRQGSEDGRAYGRDSGAAASPRRDNAPGTRQQETKSSARGGKVTRKADQKNKGAPRWLKEKRGSQE